MVGLDAGFSALCPCLLLDFRILIEVRATRRGLGKGGCAVREPDYRYAIEIFWSEEDDCFVACVPDLKNCAAWGMSYEQALTQAHAAIRADLESRRVFGDPIPEPTHRSLAEQAIG